MLNLIIALAPVGIILLMSEVLWRKKIIKGEKSRKFIHVLAGIWIAFWPLYVPLDGIFVLGFVALTLLLYSRVTKLFNAIYAVKRRTYGELLYAVSIILCAFFAKADWIFTVSILFMALADGAAAIAGRYYGLKNQYYVFGTKALTKSIVGTATFIIFVYVSLAIGYFLGGSEYMVENIILVFIVLPILVTAVENTMPYGFDNLFTPVIATLILSTIL